MPAGASISRPSRRHPVVRTIIADWRRLTGGPPTRDDARRTLAACSGGADSSALVLALASVDPPPVVAHVLHDLRPPADAIADRDATRHLAAALGLDFAEADLRVAALPGNSEANARRGRYAALADLARAHGLRVVATGHHADDQAETLLMRLLRGAGPRGLAGIRSSRPITPGGPSLVRPMLRITAQQARALCADCGWAWREDATNHDTTRRRAALRASVLPALREIDPQAARRLSLSAAHLASTAEAMDALAADLLAEGSGERGWSWPRSRIRAAPAAVLVRALRMAADSCCGQDGADRARHPELVKAATMLRRPSGERKVIVIGYLQLLADSSRVWLHDVQ